MLDTDTLTARAARAADGGLTVALAGEMDAAVAARVGEALSPLLAAPGALTLDLTGLDFMDSAGMFQVLTALRARPEPGALAVRARAGSQPARALSLTGFLGTRLVVA